MSQHITLTTDTEIALKPLVESALRAELRLLELSIQRTAERLRAFEEQYGITSEEFARRFRAGSLEESFDFIEWAGEMETHRRLEAQRQALQGVRVT